MTTPSTGQPHRPLIRWATAPFRALRYLNEELLGAGEAIARSNRFPQAGPAGHGHLQTRPMSRYLRRQEQPDCIAVPPGPIRAVRT